MTEAAMGQLRRNGQASLRVLSVRDSAWCKQQQHGTMLMEFEQLENIDLLPARSAESFAEWNRNSLWDK
jgi:hypothetical protein